MPLTKSLHTVTAVSRVAMHLRKTRRLKGPAGEAVIEALRILGYPHVDTVEDPTVIACVAATKKLMEASCANKPTP